MGVREELERIFGKDLVPEDPTPYSTDKTGIRGTPLAAVLVKDERMLVELLNYSKNKRIPITPQGALTGYSGGAVPINSIAVNFSRMDRILDIDEKNLFAVVEPGVVNKKLREEVESLGLFYPPDPASLDESSIGGNVGENASGPLSYRYGSTRDYVKGLKLFFPDGRSIEYGGKLLKNEAVYNILGLMVGSEGTLSLWTKIYLKLLPLPEDRCLLYSVFKRLEDAAKAIVEIHSSPSRPSAVELMDASSVEAVERYLGREIPGEIVLYVFVDGSSEEVKGKIPRLKDILFRNGVVEVEEAWRNIEELWAVRRALSPALNSLRDGKINEDVVVPITELPAFVRFLERIAKKQRVVMGSFGHAGEGNLHVNFMFDTGDKDEEKRAWEAVEEMMVYVSRVGGSPTGEHGIGLSKKRFLGRFFSKEELEILKTVKKAFDPQGLLNPGKIFP